MARQRSKSKPERRPLYTEDDAKRVLSDVDKTDMEAEEYRSPYSRDYARLVHAPSFRRLQGKLQLFPADDDFFRNRLTHSIEVSQIATAIGRRLNARYSFLHERGHIDLDLLAFAGLAHDLGHPPFGHSGEKILDRSMMEFGGFEGNAQTLRILSQIEEKVRDETPHSVRRYGLNLTYRTLASVLKYDRELPEANRQRAESGKIVKGYYGCERELVNDIKKHVAPGYSGDFRTVECSIMDVADDIAYSTYDMEDAFKAGILTPMRIATLDDKIKKQVIHDVNLKIDAYYRDIEESKRRFTMNDYYDIINLTFGNLFGVDQKRYAGKEFEFSELAIMLASETYTVSRLLADSDHHRTQLTSHLVGKFIRSVELQQNDEFPAMSVVRLKLEFFKVVEFLKNVTYKVIIMSPRLGLLERKAENVVKQLWGILSADDGAQLLPVRWRQLYEADKTNLIQKRIVCDFLACMTDRACIDFYRRVFGADGMSIVGDGY